MGHGRSSEDNELAATRGGCPAGWVDRVGEGQHLEHFWSAFSNRTSRARGLRSTPSGPDDWQRVAGKRALVLGGARSQGKKGP